MQFITVTLEEGDTLGGLVTKYVGDYTDENIAKIQKMNKVIIPFCNHVGESCHSSSDGPSSPQNVYDHARWLRRVSLNLLQSLCTRDDVSAKALQT